MRSTRRAFLGAIPVQLMRKTPLFDAKTGIFCSDLPSKQGVKEEKQAVV